MKLKEIILGALLLCNWQITNSASAASRGNIAAKASRPSFLLAQVTPDNTLEDENSTVVPDAEVEGIPAELIEGGAERGANLFHSFEEFSVGDGQNVYFANPEGIANIFSRVTGGDVSEILGTLGVNGSADLFLLNPNGIIFGENASLDVNGSFMASTANSILFNNYEFGANNADVPPLLTVNMPVGLNLGNNRGSIVNRSTAQDSEDSPVGLSVLAGNNLSLVGGNIRFEGGRATASGGRVELGGLSTAGTIDISENGSLTFPKDAAKADIALSDGAAVNVRSVGEGNIAVNARNFDLTGSSSLGAGITAGSNLDDAQAGDIAIDLTDNLTFDASTIVNIVEREAVGNAGDVNVVADSIEVTNRGFISAGTAGEGDAGNINIDARGDITLDDPTGNTFVSNITSRVEQTGVGEAGDIVINTENLMLTGGGIDVVTSRLGDAGKIDISATGDISIDSKGFNNGILSLVNPGAVGNAGDVNISTSNLTLKDGGRINASTLGQGDAGNVDITTTGSIIFEGLNSDGSGTSVSSLVDSRAVGDGGDIAISAGKLTLNDGGFISSDTQGEGNAGSIDITATEDFTLEGVDPNGLSSRVSSEVTLEAVGDGGNIAISAGELTLNDGGFISSDTQGEGNAGSVNITDTKDIVLKDGGFISSDTQGEGNAGSVNITATEDLTLEGVDPNGLPSRVSSGVTLEAVGDGGDVAISAGNLTVRDGGLIISDTQGKGNAGSVNITNTKDIALEDGGFIGSDTFGQGSAGSVNITDTENLTLEGTSRVSSGVNLGAVGEGGNVVISAGNLTVKDGGFITSDTFGQGNAGNIEIIASDISIDGENSNGNTTFIGSRVREGAVGNARGVRIVTDNLTITNGGFIDVSTFGQGNAGRIDVTARNIIFDGMNSLGVASSIFSQVNPSGEGNAGGIKIDTDNLTLSNEGRISTTTFGQGNAGNINIEADSLSLDSQASIDAITRSPTTNSNSAANITLQIAQGITLQDGSSISARAFENANGGNVTIDTKDAYILAFPDRNSDITANAEQGQGGNIAIDARSIFGIEERPLNDTTNDINASSEFDSSGTVEINILETDPGQDSLNIPVITTDTQVSQACDRSDDEAQSEMVVTGRGGLPDSPEANLNGGFVLEDWRVAETSSKPELRSPENPPQREKDRTESIVEADRWLVNRQGKIVLVAAQTGSSSDLAQQSADCQIN